MVPPEPDGEKGSLLILWWDFGADEGFVRKKCASPGHAHTTGGRLIRRSGSSDATQTHEDDDNPDDEGDQPGYRPYRGRADDLLAVRDTEYGAYTEEPCALQEPEQAEERYECADECAGEVSGFHARSTGTFGVG